MGGTAGSESEPGSIASSTSESSMQVLDAEGGETGEPHPGVMCGTCRKPICGDRFRCGYVRLQTYLFEFSVSNSK